jgi:sec-independent protein translocase protein TatA
VEGIKMLPGGFGPNELVLISIIVFLLFGASKIPQLAKNVGKSMGEFKKGQKEGEIALKELEHKIEGKSHSIEKRKPEEITKKVLKSNKEVDKQNNWWIKALIIILTLAVVVLLVYFYGAF